MNFFNFFNIKTSVFVDEILLQKEFIKKQKQYKNIEKTDPKIKKFLYQLNFAYETILDKYKRCEYICNLNGYKTIDMSSELYDKLIFVKPKKEYLSYIMKEYSNESLIHQNNTMKYKIDDGFMELEKLLIDSRHEFFAIKFSEIRYFSKLYHYIHCKTD